MKRTKAAKAMHLLRLKVDKLMPKILAGDHSAIDIYLKLMNEEFFK